MILAVGAVLLAYLVGAIPWSYWLVRLRRGVDLRRVGSGNLGATNVYRVAGIGAALAALVLDAGKGVAAPLVFARLPPEPVPLGPQAYATLCGVAAILGHMFPPYLCFRGGKGIATSAGVFATLEPRAFMICLGVFLLAFVVSGGIVSLGSLLGTLSLPPALAASTPQLERTSLVLVSALVVVVWIRHTANIRRLLHGQERGLLRSRAVPPP